MKRKGRLASYILLLLISVLSLDASAQYDTTEVTPIEAPPVVVEGARDYFQEPGAPEEVKERQIDKAAVQKLKSQDDYWYADFAKKRKVETRSTSLMDIGWVKVVFWILVVGIFLAALIWFLSSSNISLFSRNRKIGQMEEGEAELEEDIHSINFEKEIGKAVSESNFRLAVRLRFLQALRLMSDKQLISYSHEKTNSTYLFQLADGPFYRDFFRLTRNFEYIWYGKFDLSAEQYALVEQDFMSFKNRIGS